MMRKEVDAYGYIISKRIPAISNYGQKIITAELLNQLFDTNVALQTYYMQRYSTPYVVSETQPLAQEAGDFWIKVEADG